MSAYSAHEGLHGLRGSVGFGLKVQRHFVWVCDSVTRNEFCETAWPSNRLTRNHGIIFGVSDFPTSSQQLPHGVLQGGDRMRVKNGDGTNGRDSTVGLWKCGIKNGGPGVRMRDSDAG